MLARREYHAADRDHAFLLDRFADYGEGLRTGLAVRRNIVGVCKVEVVNFLAQHKFVDLDRARAFQRDGFQLGSTRTYSPLFSS